VTVGYGDISARTQLEMAIAIGWMLAGVGFYSFTVGSLSSFLTSIDTRESILASKMATIQEFAKEAGLSNDCKLRIRSAIRYNTFKVGNVWRDKHSLFRELPKELRFEVASSMYNGVARKFPMFAEKDPAYINFVLPLLQPLRLLNYQYVFKEGDTADEVFLITAGRVNFVIRYGEVVYKSFLRGSMIGDVEVIRQTRRVTNAMCFGNCEFLVLTGKDLNAIINEFPSEGRELISIAKEKARRIKQAYLESLSLLRVRKGFTVAPDQMGQEKLLDLEDLEETERVGGYEEHLRT
jgi:CRP-like cAMP-binding protein